VKRSQLSLAHSAKVKTDMPEKNVTSPWSHVKCEITRTVTKVKKTNKQKM